MEKIDFSSLKGTMDKVAMHLTGLALACIAGYLLIYSLARLIKLPKFVANALGTVAVLVVAYIAFRYGFIPDRF